MSDYKRKTKRCTQGIVCYAACENCFSDSLLKCSECSTEKDALACLCAYEDSGLSPAEVMELAKIVRCKDCKYFCHKNKLPFGQCDLSDDWNMELLCYCSRGELKGEKE